MNNAVKRVAIILTYILYAVALLFAYAQTHLFHFGSSFKETVVSYTTFCTVPLIILLLINFKKGTISLLVTLLIMSVTLLDYYDIPPRASNIKHFRQHVGNYEITRLRYRALAWLDYDGWFKFNANQSVQSQIINDLSLSPAEFSDYTRDKRMNGHYFWWDLKDKEEVLYYESDDMYTRLLICQTANECYLRISKN